MRARLLELLACPDCHGDLALGADERIQDETLEGRLTCTGCARSYPIRRGIPRFVEASGYTDSFGYQWRRFRTEQLDTFNGTETSARRFWDETEWDPDWLSRSRVLDAGCGAGRFVEVASRNAALVVGIDRSDAVDAAAANLRSRTNVELVQGDVLKLPFRAGAFDGCYCIGVVQHTSDPRGVLSALPRVLRSGGRIAVTSYERKPWTKLYSKYVVRRLLRNASPEARLRVVTLLVRLLFPLTDVIYRLPVFGAVFRFVIPIANYVNLGLDRDARYRWSLLDTYDMLAPVYDEPQAETDVVQWLAGAGIAAIRRLPTRGLCIVGERAQGRQERRLLT